MPLSTSALSDLMLLSAAKMSECLRSSTFSDSSNVLCVCHDNCFASSTFKRPTFVIADDSTSVWTEGERSGSRRKCPEWWTGLIFVVSVSCRFTSDSVWLGNRGKEAKAGSVGSLWADFLGRPELEAAKAEESLGRSTTGFVFCELETIVVVVVCGEVESVVWTVVVGNASILP